MRLVFVLLILVCSPVDAGNEPNFTDDLVGIFEGKWDGEYGVQLVITKSDLEFEITYLVEEVIGEPYVGFNVKGKKANSNSIMAGSLLIVVNKENRNVYVVGIFEEVTRIAQLKKVIDS